MKQSAISRQRDYNSIDLFKIIMAVFVIAIHTNPVNGCTDIKLLTIYGQIVLMAVPFFFLSSGYLLASRFDPYDQKKNLNTAANYLFKIVKMYLLWSVIYLPLDVLHYLNNGQSLKYIIVNYIKDLLFFGEHYNAWHLWYLLSTIYAIIFIIIMLKKNVSPRKGIIIIFFLCALSIIMDKITESTSVLPPIIHAFRKIISQTTVNGRILHGSFFIPIGILIAKKSIPLTTSFIIFSTSFCANYWIENSVISSILQIVCSAAFFCVIIQINLKNHSVFFLLRNLSTAMYLIHMYIWTLYYTVIYGEKRYGMDSFIVTTIISLFVGFAHLIFSKRKK